MRHFNLGDEQDDNNKIVNLKTPKKTRFDSITKKRPLQDSMVGVEEAPRALQAGEPRATDVPSKTTRHMPRASGFFTNKLLEKDRVQPQPDN